MSKKNKRIYSVDKNSGEIRNECLHRNNQKRFQADTPFDTKIVPYLIMAFCAIVDGVVFYSLFSKISYDSPLMLGVQIAGFLFGFDVVPIFIGIQYKRLRQGITRDRFVLMMAFVVCGLAFAMNIALRILTIDLISSATVNTATSYMGTVTQETAASSGIDATAIALTIFGMGIPVVTSLGSCLISFITYNPLGIRQKRIAEMMEDTRDEVRRLEAILDDYDAEDFADNIEKEDEAKYREMQMKHKAMVIGYCDYVRERLKEQLGSPASNNALSESVCKTILDRLDNELAMLDMQGIAEPVYPAKLPEKDMVYTSMIHANKATA